MFISHPKQNSKIKKNDGLVKRFLHPSTTAVPVKKMKCDFSIMKMKNDAALCQNKTIYPLIFIGQPHWYSEAMVNGDAIVPGHYYRVLMHFDEQRYVPCR